MTPDQRKSYAQALSGQKSGATWTNIPPSLSGYQVAGTSGATGLGILGLGKYRMPDGSHQVSWGLAQPALDAYRSMRYGLGFEQDPDAPPGYVSEDAISRGAFGAAGMAATGGITATTAARAAGRSLVPDNSVGMSAGAKSKTANPAALSQVPGSGSKHRPGYKDLKGKLRIYEAQGDHQLDYSEGGRLFGMISASMDKDGVGIRTSYLDEPLRGQGIGLDLYRRFIDKIHEDGHHVKSDSQISRDAARIYDRLKKMGYDVRENPDPVNGLPHRYRIAKPGTPGTEFFFSGIPGLHATEDDY